MVTDVHTKTTSLHTTIFTETNSFTEKPPIGIHSPRTDEPKRNDETEPASGRTAESNVINNGLGELNQHLAISNPKDDNLLGFLPKNNGHFTTSTDSNMFGLGDRFKTNEGRFPINNEQFTKSTSSTKEKLPHLSTDKTSFVGSALDHMTNKVKQSSRRAKQMFNAAFDSLKRLTPKAKSLYDKFQKASDESPLKLTELTENDATRLLSQLADLSLEMQEKLTRLQDLSSLTTEELKALPTDIIPALAGRVMDYVTNLTAIQLEVLCDKLMEQISHPRNLRRALDAGINCYDMLDKINFKEYLPKSTVMMKHIRKRMPPSTWTSQKLAEVVRFLGSALSEDDIEEIPVATIRNSLSDISRAHIPTKSVRYNLVKKLMGEYSSPTMWPEDFLASMGRLLEDISVQQLVLLRHGAVANVAQTLTDAGIQKDVTRIALVKNMERALRAAPRGETIAKIIPWLKTNVNFMKNVDITDLLQALSTVSVTFTAAESNMVAERLEEQLTTYEEAMDKNETEYLVDAIARFADGFDMAYLETLADEAFPKICIKMSPVRSRPKSRLFLRKLKSTQNTKLRAPEIGTLFNGINLEDVDEMSTDEIIDALPAIKDLHLPMYLERKIAKKIAAKVLTYNDGGTDCSNSFHRLGNLAKHVRPKLISEAMVTPIVTFSSECDHSYDDIKFTKAQVYAIVDNTRKVLNPLQVQADDEISVFSSSEIKKLGRLARGLTADDIEGLPLDTDLLSIIEILSEYENDLDSSQVEAIADKIREYFDIANSNELTEVDDITVLQIGRFLQYLNSDFELTKFPKHLRPLISREMGKSSLLKISNRKKQALLHFALENTKLPNSDELTDMTRVSEIDENVLMDLGNLRCGLTVDLIKKLTKEAMEVHLEDIQACPLKEREAEAVVTKALSHNINILHYREQMATMGALLLHLKESDMAKIKDNELAEITEYVAKSTDNVDVTVRTIERNGYIREWTASDNIRHDRKRKRLIQHTYKAMAKAFGSGKCHELMRLGETGKHVADLVDVSQLKRCIDHIGSIDWDPDTARMLLDRISDFQKWGTFNQRNVKENSDYLLEIVPSLIVGLSEDEISMLNLTSPDAMAALGGVDGFTERQLESGFENWLSQRRDKTMLSDEDISNLQAFVCGASPDYINSNVEEMVVKDNMDVLGKNVGKCNRDKLTAYAKKLSSVLGERSGTWPIHDIVDMGSLVGGLSNRDLASLTKSQIRVIEPEVISLMPPEKVKDFTEEQLGHMTANQVNAITSMQRSYMSQEQMDAIGVINDVVNGSVSMVPFNYTVLTIVLATLRQVLVFVIL
ncbi:uncharacterized protein LOC123562887 [Mercenaria mercenaria]|uniref:uncharacterized protein LOC123562887 n=1 Tax=Mercenaria mercenaria TaxID=6596 RepID=UPI00234EFC1B|nr:uncharacterized protein LOC123562887 [Mercenaria mercenaria]